MYHTAPPHHAPAGGHIAPQDAASHPPSVAARSPRPPAAPSQKNSATSSALPRRVMPWCSRPSCSCAAMAAASPPHGSNPTPPPPGPAPSARAVALRGARAASGNPRRPSLWESPFPVDSSCPWRTGCGMPSPETAW